MTTPSTTTVEMKLEVVVIPVADLDRAKNFYTGLGWRLDADLVIAGQRAIQVTPRGSQCSVHLRQASHVGRAPGSAQGLFLIVSDIEAARAELERHGVQVSELFHLGAKGPGAGPDPQRHSYATHAAFSDPDGNGWLLQEVHERLPGRVDAPAFGSAHELADALRRAEAAHGNYEAKIGHRDENWPDWYAEYLLREQRGEEEPS